MNDQLLDLIDAAEFTRLFTMHLGWNQPTRIPLMVPAGEGQIEVCHVADYRGLGVWHCAQIPSGAVKRAIDKAVTGQTQERLVIYSDGVTQEWCWPRLNKYRPNGAPTLVAHPHTVGGPNPDLVGRLESIRIAMGTQPTVTEVLTRVRDAFDREAETASVQAARLMGELYSQLADAGMDENSASVLLARVLLLMFGDDTEMWGPGRKDLFLQWLQEREGVQRADLAADFIQLFDIANTAPDSRPNDLTPGLATFPYINGGILADPLHIPALPPKFLGALIEACGFDWGRISPAVFGSMFQTVKNKQARAHLGEFYTSEENILRTIGPLFLDELRERLADSWDDLELLQTLHDDLATMRFMDPACGCGNFLIVAYRELRTLELDLLERRDQLAMEAAGRADGYRGTKSTAKAKKPGIAQMSLDPTVDLHITLDQFHGIEIEAWPAQIAQTAMFLVDHLANKEMEDQLGMAPDRLPIRIAPHIHHTDALTADWSSFIAPGPEVVIFGNPPFLGQYNKSKEQTALTRRVWGEDYHGYLDFVTCWYKKSIDYFGAIEGRWAFVSTNSVSQGEACAALWGPILREGWRCRFAHRSFAWTSEDPKHAAVHVSIIGFDRAASPQPILWTYPEGGIGEGTEHLVEHINPYLVGYGRNTLVKPSTRPLASLLPKVTKGSQPTDDKGKLLVTETEHQELSDDPIARRYLRRFMGADELLHGRKRWCLWVPVDDLSECLESPALAARIEAVRMFRIASPKAQTNRAAERPHRFQEDRQPSTDYLAIPRSTSESRQYIPAAYLTPDIICSDANFTAADPSGFLLGVLSSSMFMTWQKTIGGRLKSDIRFSNTFTYHTFPLPNLPETQVKELAEAGQGIVTARGLYPDRTLAQLYDPSNMPPELLTAHARVDSLLDAGFGLPAEPSLEERQISLFQHYERLVASLET